MNNRDYKQFAPGEYYHVYNRGNAKMDIFCDGEDYDVFLRRLLEAVYPERPSVNGAHSQRNQRKPLPAGAFSLVAYCLMPNHFHLLVGQHTELPVSALMLKVATSYSKLFNKKYSRVGSIFQDQFKAVRVESNEQLLYLSAYIHLNPKKTGIGVISTYPYSSYQEYLSGEGNTCSKDLLLEQCGGSAGYRILVESQSVNGAHSQGDLGD